MRAFVSLGSTPTDEECAQVGSPDYESRVIHECAAYINQLRRVFGDEPLGARLSRKTFQHDFGFYIEIVCYYENEEACKYAFNCENNQPELWDEQAKEELKAIEIAASYINVKA